MARAEELDDRVPHPGPHHHCEAATALQRAGAWALNAVVIVAWIGFVSGLRLFAFGDASPPTADSNAKFVGHGIGLLTLTLPVLLYFSLSEWRWGYTLGKAALGLRVVDDTGHYPTSAAPSCAMRSCWRRGRWRMRRSGGRPDDRFSIRLTRSRQACSSPPSRWA